MRSLLLLLVGLLSGAVLFHLYYLALVPVDRCRWDHPFDAQARQACVARETFAGYAKGARRQLDRLIDDVSH